MVQPLKTLWTIVGLLTQLHLTDSNPHQPWKWELSCWKDQQVVWTWVGSGSPWFAPTPCWFFPGLQCPKQSHFYLCPAATGDRSYCNSPGEYFCARWGCETVATGWQPAFPDKHLKLTWGPPGCSLEDYPPANQRPCQVLNITVTTPEDPGWLAGRTWGLRVYESGRDRGNLILIKKVPLQVS